MIPLLIAGLSASGLSATLEQQPLPNMQQHSYYQQQFSPQSQNLPPFPSSQNALPFGSGSVGQNGCPPTLPFTGGQGQLPMMPGSPLGGSLFGQAGQGGLQGSPFMSRMMPTGFAQSQIGMQPNLPFLTQGGSTQGGFMPQGQGGQGFVTMNDQPKFFSGNGSPIQAPLTMESPLNGGNFSAGGVSQGAVAPCAAQFPAPEIPANTSSNSSSANDLLSQITALLQSMQGQMSLLGSPTDTAPTQPEAAPTPAPAPIPPQTTSVSTPTVPTTTAGSLSPLEAAVLQETNNVRAQNNLPPYTEDDTLSSVARAHSADMQSHNYFSHNDLSGCSPSCRLDNVGYAWQAMGENIHMMSGFNLSVADAAKKIVTDWMNSPDHKANLLNATYTKVGVGISQQGDSIYTTSDYALPR